MHVSLHCVIGVSCAAINSSLSKTTYYFVRLTPLPVTAIIPLLLLRSFLCCHVPESSTLLLPASPLFLLLRLPFPLLLFFEYPCNRKG